MNCEVERPKMVPRMESLQRQALASSWWTPKVRTVAWVLVLCVSGAIVGSAAGYWVAQQTQRSVAADGTLPRDPAEATSSTDHQGATSAQRVQ